MPSQIPPLPQQVADLINTYIQGLLDILGDDLYGAYMYGASVFPESGPLQDIDCHVVIRNRLNEIEVKDLKDQYEKLGECYPGLGDELDAYVILLEDAKGHDLPQHQVLPDVYDYAWALHCAHIRAGKYRLLYGPIPNEIFPTPTWDAIDKALQHELKYVLEHPQYPAYGILNLCRILYSYTRRDPAISKQFSGFWGMEQFPQWALLIQAAMRFYRKEHTQEDNDTMESQGEVFYDFMVENIKKSR